MYGDPANKLIRELKRYENFLPPYNDNLVSEINSENIYLFKEAQRVMKQVEQQREEGNQTAYQSSVAYSKLCGAVIHRNKR
jgi:hypothetical protein